MGKSYKIAVISDIHSNYVALKAVMDEINREGYDDIVVAGDNIGLFAQPNQTVELLQKLDAKIIKGNSEDYLRNYDNGTNAHWEYFHQMKPMVWTHGKLTDDNLGFVLNLPEQLTFEACDTSFRVVHGSLNAVNELIYKHEEDKIKNGLACAKEDVLLCGHSHQQWSEEIDGTLIVNPGSLGISFMGKGIAPYSILTKTEDGWHADLLQAKYNVSKVKTAMDKADIKSYEPWAKMLIHSITDGKVATLAFLKHAYQHARNSGWDGQGDLVPNKYWQSAFKEFDFDNFECMYSWIRAN